MIFLSYSRRDGIEYVEKLEKALDEKGIKTWRDTRRIRPEYDFTAEIEKGIVAASLIAVCVTLDSTRSDSFVRREIQFAHALGKPVLPLRFANVPPHISIINNEWLNFFDDWDIYFDRLCEIYKSVVPISSRREVEPLKRYLYQLYRRIVEIIEVKAITFIEQRMEDAPGSINKLLFLEHMDVVAKEAGAEKYYNNFEEAFTQNDERILLLGEPGAGKTTTLLAFARDRIVLKLDDLTQHPLPIFAFLSLWNQYPNFTLLEMLSSGGSPVLQALIKEAITHGNSILVLDGLDELTSIGLSERFVEEISQVHEHNQIAISCRREEYRQIGRRLNLEGAVILQPLNNGEIARFLEGTPALREAIERDEDLQKLAKLPLFLSFLATAFQSEDEIKALTSIDTENLRDKIFEKYVIQQYKKYQKYIEPGKFFGLEEFLSKLGEIALANTIQEIVGENIFSKKELELILRSQTDEFIKFTTRAYILVISIDHDHYSFIHILLRNSLAYIYCIKNLENIKFYGDLAKVSPASALAKLRGKSALKTLIDLLEKQDVDALILREIVNTLGQFGDESAKEVLQKMLYQENNENYLINILDALEKLGDSSVPELLYKTGINDSVSWDLRDKAIIRLHRLDDERAFEILLSILSKPGRDVTLLSSAMTTLEQIGYSEDSIILIQLLQNKDTDYEIRGQSLKALRSLKDLRAIQPLTEILLNLDEDSYLRQDAAYALGDFGDMQSVPHLIGVLQHQDVDDYIRMGVISSLGSLRSGQAVPFLITVLENELEPFPLQQKAAEALNAIGTIEAMESANKWLAEQQPVEP